ncbi:hypothetical protein [Peribacillus tepidiphilus]|uniref:hypothetical protein n=1 Tax=Peribacillus tepidiphilus TaxID=2652445 RepID=UPI001291F788|nr:hypothetical protein [Peribacillus tepidiphilus]
MKKALVNNLEGDEKMAASEYAIEVHHKSDEVIELNCVQYSFEDVFEYIKEYYSDKNDVPVDKIVIRVKR